MLSLLLFAVDVLGVDHAPRVMGDQVRSAYHSWASTPPMGWNSWDCFGTTLTEDQAKSQADAMVKHLKPFGWNVFTVDIQWYEPHSNGHVYKDGATLQMDEFGRLLPATTKFPASANGRGFKPLADYIHARGLKFGIHIMRGIPRQAVKNNTPIKGTKYRASDVADVTNTCSWNPDMYGVDLRKPGAQAYYDSLFSLYASWGLDFVKVDDISRPYDDFQLREIEAIRRAIDKSGRKIVLSLSPGNAPLERGDHVSSHANMWRISDDFWDRWEPLHGMFDLLDKWTPFRKTGAWPDADMLPFGIVEFQRRTHFTPDEQTLCMSLWSIARSPLILGADMTKMDPFTLGLLTNPEVIAVNQKSTGNRQVSRQNDLIVWTADIPGSQDRYVGLFNAQDKPTPYDYSKAAFKSARIDGKPEEKVAEIHASLGKSKRLILMVTDGGDGFSFDHAAWVEPTLTGPKGSLKLSSLKWRSASAGWGEARVDRTVDNGPVMMGGVAHSGIGTHSQSVIEYEIPEGYDTFDAKGILTEGSEGKGSVEFVVLTESAVLESPSHVAVQVNLADLGFRGPVQVRDLWRRKDLGTFSSTFEQKISFHGAGLYRVSPSSH